MVRIVLGMMLVALSVGPSLATAHTLGASLEQAAGDYWIDIGYDPSQVTAGDRMIFDFNLAEAAATSTSVSYDYVWVRLYGDDRTLLATGVHRADIGPTTLLYTVPRDAEGDLTLSVRYQKDNTTLAESDFTLSVAPLEDSKLLFGAIGIAFAAAVLGAGVAITFLRWRMRSVS